MNNKRWLKIFVLLSSFLVGSIGLFNYIMDPLWNFSHKFDFNNIQNGFDERQQKTNFVNSRNMDKYEGLLLGSSRSTHINQMDFVGMNIFNYAISSIQPYEYKEYIDFFKKNKNKKKLKYIIIGADFYGTNKPKDVKFEEPIFYINKTESFGYRYKILFSLDGFKKSKDNLINYFKGSKEYYNRDNIKYMKRVSEEERLARYTANLKRHTETFIGDNYEYNNELVTIYKTLKKDNLGTEIIIFTSPVTADLLVSIIKNGNRLKEYKDWLHNMVKIFGKIYHFMDINSITTNLNNYPDDDHYYCDVGTLLANKVSKSLNKNIPEDFGILLNKENIDKYLINFEKKLIDYKNPLERTKDKN